MPPSVLGEMQADPACLTLPSDDPWVCRCESLVMRPEIVKVVYRFLAQGLFGQIVTSRGIWSLLLCGEPGCGKTTLLVDSGNRLARSKGKQIKVLRIECSKIYSDQLGASCKNMIGVIDRAESLSSVGFPTLLMLDDVDGIGMARSLMARGGNPADTQHTVVALLAGLDRLANRPGVAIVGTTNHPNLLDEALLDRFGPVIHVPPADLNTRSKILVQYLGGAKSRVLDDDPSDLEEVSRRVEGWSGRALMQRLVQTATLLADKPPEEITCKDLNNALDLLSGETK